MEFPNFFYLFSFRLAFLFGRIYVRRPNPSPGITLLSSAGDSARVAGEGFQFIQHNNPAVRVPAITEKSPDTRETVRGQMLQFEAL